MFWDGTRTPPPPPACLGPGSVAAEIEIGVPLLSQVDPLLLCHQLEGGAVVIILGYFLEQLIYIPTLFTRRFKQLSFYLVSVVLDIVVIHLPRAAVVPNEVTLGAAQVDSAQLFTALQFLHPELDPLKTATVRQIVAHDGCFGSSVVDPAHGLIAL